MNKPTIAWIFLVFQEAIFYFMVINMESVLDAIINQYFMKYFKWFILCFFAFIPNAFAKGGYWFNLYCQASDNRTLATTCRPAIEGAWEFYGGSYNYQYSTPRYGSMDEVSINMQQYIDNKFGYCKPTRAYPTGPAIPSVDNAGLITISYEMTISIGRKNGNTCEEALDTRANTYTQEKRFYCEASGTGPYLDDDKNRFCAYPQKFNINISGSSVTQALPSLAGPITQTITVMGEDGPAKNWRVQIKAVNEKGTVSYGGGTTDDQGAFEFLYLPPFVQASYIDLSATCTSCEKANKSITVLPVDLPITDEPQMCTR